MLLNTLDYFVKHGLRVKYYIRYVDDFIIFDKNKEKLERWKKCINKFLWSLGLKLHPQKSKVVPLHQGIKFLGFRIFYHYKLLKRSGVAQIKRNLLIWKHKYSLGEEYEHIIARLLGWLAHAQHGDTYYLRKKIVARFNRLILL